MVSKEDNIMRLFFNEPTKEWHFEQILEHANIARSKADKWLKTFIKQALIKRIKEKGKMPYYISDYNSPSYKNKKKIFALNQLYDCGLLNHLTSLPKAETVIIFGSFARSDWYTNSDIDIFILGNSEGLNIAKYELKLNRSVELFICKQKQQLKKFGQGLLQNIINGNILKGNLNFIKIDLNA